MTRFGDKAAKAHASPSRNSIHAFFCLVSSTSKPQLYTAKAQRLTRAFSETVSVEGRPSIWFGGMQVDDFPGHTRTAKLSQMAASMGIHILSPVATGRQSPSKETSHPGYIPFVDEAMVREAHRAGLVVKPWTVNTLSVAERLMELGVDGLISDCE